MKPLSCNPNRIRGMSERMIISHYENNYGGALGKIAIGDWLTAAIGIVSLEVLFRWKVSNPVLIAVTAVVGLIAYPLLQPEWVMVK